MVNGLGKTFQPFSFPWNKATIIPKYVGAFLDNMSPPNAERSNNPWRSPKTDIEHGNVSKAKANALSSKTVLDPDLIHCSIVSSNISAFREMGNWCSPGSGRYRGFASNVLWHGDKFPLATKNIR